MDTKTVAVVTVFAALAIALNLSPIRFPAPYAPFLIYQAWEIPIVVAFLLYGARVGVILAMINTIALLVIFPGALPTGPFYNLAAVLSMMLGMGIVKVFVDKHSPKHNEVLIAVAFMALGITLRTGVMAFFNWALLRFPPPVGYDMPEPAIIATIPLVVFFNISLAFYTILIGCILAKIVEPYSKVLM